MKKETLALYNDIEKNGVKNYTIALLMYEKDLNYTQALTIWDKFIYGDNDNVTGIFSIDELLED